MNDTITKIASDILHIDTLETQFSDKTDFHDMPVWTLKTALEAAYTAGLAFAKSEPPANAMLSDYKNARAFFGREFDKLHDILKTDLFMQDKDVSWGHAAVLRRAATGLADVRNALLSDWTHVNRTR